MTNLVLRWWWLIPLWFALIFAAAYLTKFFSPNRNDAKLREAEGLFAGIQIYPASREVHRSETSKDRIATIGKQYECAVSYEDLKKYYINQLQNLGWVFEDEQPLTGSGRRLSFRQREFELHVEYLGQAQSAGWDYAINVTWNP